MIRLQGSFEFMSLQHVLPYPSEYISLTLRQPCIFIFSALLRFDNPSCHCTLFVQSGCKDRYSFSFCQIFFELFFDFFLNFFLFDCLLIIYVGIKKKAIRVLHTFFHHKQTKWSRKKQSYIMLKAMNQIKKYFILNILIIYIFWFYRLHNWNFD